MTSPRSPSPPGWPGRLGPPLLLLLLGLTTTAGLWLRGQRQHTAATTPKPANAATVAGEDAEQGNGVGAGAATNVAPQELEERALLIPVEGVRPADLRDSFDEGRVGHTHNAIDILAPRNTPVRAVEDGVIAKLFISVPGGITIYQFDPSGDYCYYYAHLERYADGLANGRRVRRGEIIGYVGTSGNAPADTPHLHFAIYRLDAAKRWWEGTPLDPYPALRGSASAGR